MNCEYRGCVIMIKGVTQEFFRMSVRSRNCDGRLTKNRNSRRRKKGQRITYLLSHIWLVTTTETIGIRKTRVVRAQRKVQYQISAC